jgi:hypothetical protein
MKNISAVTGGRKYRLEYVVILVAFLLPALRVTAQNKHPTIFSDENFIYSRTDFTVVDTLVKWTYTLDLKYKGAPEDSVKPIGQIKFYRAVALPDSISQHVYGTDWTPVMNFEIYNLRDAAFCRKKATHIRIISSCVPPSLGGDMFIVGQLVFVNPSPCVNCYKYDTDRDYCRPLIKYVFSKVDETKATTIQDIVKQFPIKESAPKKKA